MGSDRSVLCLSRLRLGSQLPDRCLSVSDPTEAAKVVDKVIRWHENADWSWFRNVQLAGISSLVDLRAEREGLFEGMKVNKCLWGGERWNRVFLEPALTTRDTGIFLAYSHGGVTHWAFPGSILFADDLLRYPPHAKVPIVISIACMPEPLIWIC